MLLSSAHVVLAVGTGVHNYEALGEQLKGSHLRCTESRNLVAWQSTALVFWMHYENALGIEEPGYVYLVRTAGRCCLAMYVWSLQCGL